MFCSAVLGVALYRLSADTDFLFLSFWDFFFVLFCHDVMPTLDCMICMECVEDHLLFIRVIVSLYSGQSVSVLVHVCSTSPGKEVRGSLCQNTVFVKLGDWTSPKIIRVV